MQGSFYTQEHVNRILHTEALYTEVLTHRSSYTQTLLHTDASTQSRLLQQKLLPTDFFSVQRQMAFAWSFNTLHSMLYCLIPELKINPHPRNDIQRRPAHAKPDFN